MSPPETRLDFVAFTDLPFATGRLRKGAVAAQEMQKVWADEGVTADHYLSTSAVSSVCCLHRGL